MNFDPKEKYAGGVVYGGKIFVRGVPRITDEEAAEAVRCQMEEIIPPAYRHNVIYQIDSNHPSGQKELRWLYDPSSVRVEE